MSNEAMMAIGAVLIASGVTTFSIFIALLVPLNEWPVVLTVPLLEGQWVTIDAAGAYTLRRDAVQGVAVCRRYRHRRGLFSGRPGHADVARMTTRSMPARSLMTSTIS